MSNLTKALAQFRLSGIPISVELYDDIRRLSKGHITEQEFINKVLQRATNLLLKG